MEGNKLSNSYDTIADSDENDDAGIFSIDNDYTSEAENILVEEENELLVVRTRRTETNERRVGRGILLAREAVVYFVQESISYAVDQQKRNADQYGRI